MAGIAATSIIFCPTLVSLHVLWSLSCSPQPAAVSRVLHPGLLTIVRRACPPSLGDPLTQRKFINFRDVEVLVPLLLGIHPIQTP